MEDTQCGLEMAVAWSVSAKNSLKNVSGYSPCQLVFGWNPNFPNVCDNLPPALECSTSSEIVANNLNAMHAARAQFVKSEASEKLARALRHQTRTYGDVRYSVNDEVYFRRANDKKWRGPGTVIGTEGKQVLVKQGSGYIRVHPCNLRPVNENTMQCNPAEPANCQQSDVCSDSRISPQVDVSEHAIKVLSVDDGDDAGCLAG